MAITVKVNWDVLGGAYIDSDVCAFSPRHFSSIDLVVDGLA
jgi:hypothetical protein